MSAGRPRTVATGEGIKIQTNTAISWKFRPSREEVATLEREIGREWSWVVCCDILSRRLTLLYHGKAFRCRTVSTKLLRAL